MKKNVFEILGYWDNKIYEGDFDMYIRSKLRHSEKGDIKPIHILQGIYFHHYSKLTYKAKFNAPYIDVPVFVELEDKWGKEKMHEILADIEY